MEKSKLNYEQSLAAYHVNGPMLVLAGPGSGKTHLLVERIRIMIEEKGVKPDEILVITFSKKSALEMENRFFSLVNNAPYSVTFGTFHAVFYDILKHYYNFTKESILTEPEKLELIRHGDGDNVFIGHGDGDFVPEGDEKDLQGIVDNISAYKNFGEDFFTKTAGKYMTIEEQDSFREIYKYYCRRSHELGKLDFDDMVLLVRDLFLKHEGILREWQKRYRYFLVDEFQDINDAQYDVLRLLAGDCMNVFAVGDDDQSIYAFRGAKPSLMQKFLKQYHGCKRVNLTMNYRCCENIIKCADSCIRHNADRLDRPMQRHLPSKNGGGVEVNITEGSISQAEYVCAKISGLMAQKGYSYDDFAVLYRSEHCATMLKTILKSNNLPVKSGDSGINPYTDKVTDIVIAYLKCAIGNCTRNDFLLMMNNPKRGLSREAISAVNDGKNHDSDDYFALLRDYYDEDNKMLGIINELAQVITKIRKGSSADALKILQNIDILGTLSGDSNSSNIEVFNFLNDFSRDFVSISEFVEHVMNMREKSHENEDNSFLLHNKKENTGINLMTAHASKGLEFKVVFVIGLQEGLFPHHKSMEGMLVEEERRLMYVAMTRAKERLYLCGIGTKHGKRVSRFVGEIV